MTHSDTLLDFTRIFMINNRRNLIQKKMEDSLKIDSYLWYEFRLLMLIKQNQRVSSMTAQNAWDD